MVVVAQLVRAPDCGSGGRRFETDLPPESKDPHSNVGIFSFILSLHCYSESVINFITVFQFRVVALTLSFFSNRAFESLVLWYFPGMFK